MPCSYCNAPRILAKGLCSACYQRQWRNGTADRLKVKKPVHLLNNTWRLLRSRWKGFYPPEWDDFDTFVAAVGERPSAYAQLRRKRDSEPYSAENIRWVEHGIDGGKANAEYGREWAFRNKYGITIADYDALLEEQGGGCAICGAERSFTKGGKGKRLAVDHDHETGEVRGLLCVTCNRGLGYFSDSETRLQRAAAYVAKARRKRLKVVS